VVGWNATWCRNSDKELSLALGRDHREVSEGVTRRI
jgi:hypothetical protein